MELSQHANELLHELDDGDPWARLCASGFRARRRFRDLASVRKRSPEDLYNYLAADALAAIIVLQDLADGDVFESLKDAYEAIRLAGSDSAN